MNNPATERQQYLAFSLAGGDYAVGILKVKEILQYEEVTPVPSTPPSIRGVLNLRGSVVPVVDLTVKFGAPAAGVTKRTGVLVVETMLDGVAAVMGLVANAVSEVIELRADDIEAAPAFGSHVHVDYLLGMGKVGKKFVLLLDIDRVLSADERELAAAAARGETLRNPAADTSIAANAAQQANPEALQATP
jgi:purine-binding chemotaxis protein CheW